MFLFHTHIVVDWSARSRPSPAQPTKDAIWWAVARTDGGAADAPEYARTRHDALRRLARLVTRASSMPAGACWWALTFPSAIPRVWPSI